MDAVAETLTIDRTAGLPPEIRACFEAGDPALGVATARAAYHAVETRSARIDYLKHVFVLMRDLRCEAGVAFALRALRKLDILSFGEGRRLFLALERTRKSALIDRYVGVLHRGLPATGMPLRKALNLLWATGRPVALLDYIRANAPKRLTDRETIEFYAAQFVKFNDRPRSAPLFAHLVTLDPANVDARLQLAGGLVETEDYAAAAREIVAASEVAGHRNEAGRAARHLADALYESVAGDPSPDMADVVRRALAEIEPVDPGNPRYRAIARALAIVGTPTPKRRSAAAARQAPLAGIEEAIALLTPLQSRTRAYRLVCDATAALLRTIDLPFPPDLLDKLLLLAPELADVVAGRFPTATDAPSGIALFQALNGDHTALVWTHAIGLAHLAGSSLDVAEFTAKLAASEPAAETPQRRSLTSIGEAVDLLGSLQPGTRSHKLVSQAAATLLRTADLSAGPTVLTRLLALSPGLAEILVERFSAPDEAAAGVALFRGLRNDLSSTIWIHGTKLAALADLPEAVADFAIRLASDPDVAVNDLKSIARRFTPAQSAELDRFWTLAVTANASDRIVPTALRSLYGVENSTAFYPLARGIAAGKLRSTIEVTAYLETIRTVLARGWRWNDAGSLSGAADALDPDLPPDVALWTRAMFACATFDYDAARALLDQGVERWPDSGEIAFAEERAALAARFGHYGAVAEELAELGRAPSSHGAYAALRKVHAIIKAAPPPRDALYPQYLIDAIFDRAPSPGYQPVPNSLVTIVAALAAGGSERQAVSVIEAISRDPRVATQTLLVRSVTPERRGFFLPQVEASNIPFQVFEHDTADEAEMLALLQEPTDSRLSIALPLLPENLRTTICHLVPRLLELRPAVVHIRQDFFAAALACVLAGVPRFFIHRGSLTPNHWDLTVPQHIATVAPMQHTYRRLVSWPGFGFINNAASGVRSDIEWTGEADPARFSLVHNIVDFARLGPSRDADDAVRRSIGAAPGDLVVGAAFRFHRVKRPLLWLAAARHVLTRHPEARFLMLGDGEMKDVMTAFAEAEGFADRLHLPGSISDLGPWYRAMDVALLTSDREGLPNMLIEAQHFGVIPVSTDVGGAGETMAAGVTGILVPADSTPQAIGDAIVAAFDDRAWFDHARATAPGFVHERFGAKTAIDQIIGLYGFADAARSPL